MSDKIKNNATKSESGCLIACGYLFSIFFFLAFISNFNDKSICFFFLWLFIVLFPPFDSFFKQKFIKYNEHIDLKKIEPFSLNALYFILKWAVILLMSFIVISVSINFSKFEEEKHNIQSNTNHIKTKSEIKDKKNIFKGFKENLLSIPTSCDHNYKRAISSLEQYEMSDAYSNFETARYACLEASNKFKSVKLPDGLTNTEELKKLKEDLSTAYIFKYSAAKNTIKYLETNNIKYSAKADDSAKIYLEKMNYIKLNIVKIESSYQDK